ncbi:hypothetical protein [Bacteroides thetaiotaomicron]|uniref:hypothetical protein n=1 Tax=Bacteroides thetaiotaomicron TaxID=818 RepID=UPI003DA4F087
MTFDKQTGKFRFAPLRQREEQAQGKQQKEEQRQMQKEENKDVLKRRMGRKM